MFLLQEKAEQPDSAAVVKFLGAFHGGALLSADELEDQCAAGKRLGDFALA